MRQRARAINPNMEFWPLMYYPEMDRAFVANYGSAIDGVVAAYPKTAQTVQRTWLLLNDQRDSPARWQFSYPERIRDKVKMALVQRRRGFCEGVVTYALPKSPDDEIFKTIRRLFLKASTSRSADFDNNEKIDFEDFLLFANAYGKIVGEYATVFAPFDLDLDGKVGFGDFLIFVQAFETQ